MEEQQESTSDSAASSIFRKARKRYSCELCVLHKRKCDFRYRWPCSECSSRDLTNMCIKSGESHYSDLSLASEQITPPPSSLSRQMEVGSSSAVQTKRDLPDELSLPSFGQDLIHADREASIEKPLPDGSSQQSMSQEKISPTLSRTIVNVGELCRDLELRDSLSASDSSLWLRHVLSEDGTLRFSRGYFDLLAGILFLSPLDNDILHFKRDHIDISSFSKIGYLCLILAALIEYSKDFDQSASFVQPDMNFANKEIARTSLMISSLQIGIELQNAKSWTLQARLSLVQAQYDIARRDIKNALVALLDYEQQHEREANILGEYHVMLLQVSYADLFLSALLGQAAFVQSNVFATLRQRLLNCQIWLAQGQGTEPIFTWIQLQRARVDLIFVLLDFNHTKVGLNAQNQAQSLAAEDDTICNVALRMTANLNTDLHMNSAPLPNRSPIPFRYLYFIETIEVLLIRLGCLKTTHLFLYSATPDALSIRGNPALSMSAIKLLLDMAHQRLMESIIDGPKEQEERMLYYGASLCYHRLANHVLQRS